jgi:hypothetical protein
VRLEEVFHGIVVPRLGAGSRPRSARLIDLIANQPAHRVGALPRAP